MTDPTTTPETKACPDCAELVLAEANVCKHCGYRFAGVAPAEAKSPALAALLSLIIPGAGQLYIGENGRGVLYLLALAIAAYAAAITNTVGPAPVLAIIAAIDAYQAAGENEHGTRRAPSLRLGAVVAAVAVLAAVGISNHDRRQRDADQRLEQQLRQAEQDAQAERDRQAELLNQLYP